MSSIASMLSLVLAARHDPIARILNVDLLAVLVAALLPWSTTGVAIGIVLWLVALAVTLELQPFLRSLRRPICALPIALVGLAVLGTLWSDAPWGARLYSLSPATKLLALPFLFYHFERSRRGMWVFVAFLASCTLLMAVSWIVVFDPSLSLKRPDEPGGRGIFVKNYIDQSQEFALCAVALAYPIYTLLRDGKIWLALLLTAIAANFVFNMAFVIVSRTALVTLPVMFAVFAMAHLKWRTVVLCTATVVLGGAGLDGVAAIAGDDGYVRAGLPDLQGVQSADIDRAAAGILGEVAALLCRGAGHRPRHRIDAELFEAAASGPAVLAQGQVIGNPHNQTLNVAVQWGTFGVVILYAMWFSHFSLFRGEGLATWIGLMVVLQNVFTSLFNSHLFDFHEGWMYVLGVGVAGGMALQGRIRERGRGTSRNCPAMIAGMHAADEISAGAGYHANPRISASGHWNDASFATDPSQLPDRSA